jgi:hypothetical protein
MRAGCSISLSLQSRDLTTLLMFRTTKLSAIRFSWCACSVFVLE